VTIRRRRIALVLPTALSWSARALGGPPFSTDDPEPVEYRHWEAYLGSVSSHDRGGWSGTAPHVELNYGVVPEVQLHLLLPLAYAAADGSRAHYGLGDTELGAKVRFARETSWTPQLGTFPLVELPTGSTRAGLGSGTAQLFLPLWIQKSFGDWLSYGGAGIWVDPGQRHRHWWFFGWLLQVQVAPSVALGAELFHVTRRESGTSHDTRFNVGMVIDLNERDHLLASAGRGLSGPNLFQGYIAYQATLGP
jgi:hypothetical protein